MACTTAGGWLCHWRGQVTHVDGSPLLPDDEDAVAAIFTRLSDAADIVRCAATCRVVAKEAAVLSRSLPAQLTRTRAIFGVFHQEDAGITSSRKRKRGTNGGSSGQPRFVPTAAVARRLRIPSTNEGHGALLKHARPVASRNGRVVFELRRDGHGDGLKLCVLNPMIGETALLPPLSGKDKPGCYAIALLTDDDDDGVHERPPPTTAFFFRVVIVYNRRSFTALRAYSSDTARWSSEVQRRPKIDSHRLRELGQSVVLRGVAFWPLHLSALAVRLDAAGEPREVAMPSDGILVDTHQHTRLMAVVTTTEQHGNKQQEELCFMDAGFHVDRSLLRAGLPCRTIVLRTNFLRAAAVGNDDMAAGRWERRGRGIRLPPEMKVRSWDAVKLRWFCEKSGVVVFTVGQDSNCPGAYALDVATHRVEKMAHGAACDAWRNVVGYEMDAPACLASIACY